MVREIVQIYENAGTENLGGVRKTRYGFAAHARWSDDSSNNRDFSVLDVLPNEVEQVEHARVIEARTGEDQLDVVVIERRLRRGEVTDKQKFVACQDSTDTVLGIRRNCSQNTSHCKTTATVVPRSPFAPRWRRGRT